jgi:cytochrome c oxidase subunit IV
MSTDNSKPHVLPLKTYFSVFGALLFLTIVTVWVSHLNLGAIAIHVAMFIALIKATLVAAIFMHLKYEDRFHTFVFASSILFMAIFLGLTFMDLQSRDWVLPEQGNDAYRSDYPWQIEYKKAPEHH